MGNSSLSVGTRVIVGRDEERYPARGSWTRYRGRRGVIVSLNRNAGEFGVSFSERNTIGPNTSIPVDAWFLPHELQML